MKIYLIIQETHYDNVDNTFHVPSNATTEKEALLLLDAHIRLNKDKNKRYSICKFIRA